MNVTILCGGNGSRLWPLSRNKLPKQFLKLVNDKTMFQNTVLRFQSLEVNRYIIICNKEHHFIIEEQMIELNLDKDYMIVTEPMGRDTAAAVATASLLSNPEDTTLIVPCDHVFDDAECCNIVK